MDTELSKQTNKILNISNDTCPMTFVKTKLAIEKMTSGEVLEVILSEGEPLENVPISIKEEGHEVLEVIKDPDTNYYRIMIRIK